MQEKKLYLISICGILLSSFLVLLSACSPVKPVIKIGANVEITGESPSIGTSCLNAAQLFIDEANQSGGIPINGTKIPLTLVIGDNSGKPDQAATIAQRLISQEGVIALVGPNISSCAIPAAEIAESFDCLMLSPLSTNQRTTLDSLTGKPKKSVFRASFTESVEELALAQFALNQLHRSRAAILYDVTSEAPNSEAQLFKKEFTKNGGTIVAMETYSTGDRDFSAQLTNIKKTNPDLIFLPAYYNDVPLIANQARRLGITATLLGNSAWSTPEIINLDSEHHLEGAYFSNHFDMEASLPKVRRFINAYHAKYGTLPDEVAALTYDSMSLIVESIIKAGKLDRSAICEAMQNIRTFQGLTGDFSYPKGSRDPAKKIIILQLKDGKFRDID